ncbi:MAG: SH3 domain-containing protein, partial [Streptococcus sp.]|nr:SH3 domain-containing protein [Streptococcus sp.]
MKKQFFSQRVQRFSIRKYSFGVASILLCSYLILGAQTVKAEEQVNTSSNPLVKIANEQQSDNIDTYNNLDGVDFQENSSNISNEDVTTSLRTTDSENAIKNLEKTTNKRNEDLETPTVTTSTIKSDPENENLQQPSPSLTNSDEVTIDNLETKKISSEASIDDIPRGSVNTSGSIAVGDDYPTAWKSSQSMVDSWGYYTSNCTSFVANRLHNVNKFEMPRAIGNGAQWGNSARHLGYRVDNTPTLGSVAWLDDGRYGHVAWVSGIFGNNVEIEEYNYNWSGRYNKRVISRTSFSGYIHFKDLGSGESSNNTSSDESNNSGNSLPSSGVYHFTSRMGIKSEPKISSPDIAYYDNGNSVNYDRTLTSDNYHWISYLTYSGARRYIAINQIAAPATPKVSGHISIQNKNIQNGTFDVVITNVTSNRGLKEVQVPVWSNPNGEDM